jgi:hypothetical protein
MRTRIVERAGQKSLIVPAKIAPGQHARPVRRRFARIFCSEYRGAKEMPLVQDSGTWYLALPAGIKSYQVGEKVDLIRLTNTRYELSKIN